MWFASGIALAVAGAGLLVVCELATGRGSADIARVTDPKSSPLFNSPTWISLGTMLNQLTLGAVLALWLWRVKPPLSVALPLRVPSLLSVFGAALLVFGLGPFAEASGVLVKRLLKPEVTIANVVLSAAGGKSALEFAAVLLSLAVLPALVEEAMFRGAITASFARSSRVVQVAVPSLLFGLFHLEPTQVAGTIVLGLGFGVARLLSESLWPGVIAHGLFNALVVIGARFNNEAPDWQIRGGELLVGGALTGLGIFLLIWSRPKIVSHQATAVPKAPSPS